MIRLACLTFATAMLWLSVFCMMAKAWVDHPAEQPVNGQIYLASIQDGGDSCGNLQI